MREDNKGCVLSCAHYKTSTGNPTYKKKDEMKCIAACEYPTVINLA